MSDLPAEWAEATLADVAKWGSGGTPTSTNAAYYGGDIPWAVIGDLTDGFVNRTAKSITQRGIDESSAKLVEPGTLLIAMYGSIGRLGIARIPMATNQAIATAVPNTRVIDPAYLFWYLRSQRARLTAAGKGATQDNVGQGILKAWPIPLAPPAEQRRIVEAIEEQFSRLDAAEESLSRATGRLRSLHQALLANLVGLGSWSREPLVDICARIVDCEHSTAKFLPAGVACVDTTNIEPGRIMVSRLRYVSEDTYQQRVRRMKPQAGDVLFAREGTVGTAVLVPENLRLCLGQRVMALRPSDRILPKFLELTLNSPVVRRQYEAKILGTTAPHLNVADIRRLQVPLPSLQEQGQIVQEAERQMTMLDSLAHGVALTVRRAKSLRRATLHEAFAGRLTPG